MINHIFFLNKQNSNLTYVYSQKGNTVIGDDTPEKCRNVLKSESINF